MKMFLLVFGLLMAGTAMAANHPAASKHGPEHGKWLIGYGGCNDCHTPGWAEHGGKAPKDLLLTGSGMNFQGPWGTTYPINLRLYVQKLTLEQWIADMRKLKTRPAMPFWTFRYLSDQDLADMYAYIHALGPAGKPTHDYVPPGQAAPLPYFKLKLPPPPIKPAVH